MDLTPSYVHEQRVAELAVLQASILTKQVQSTVSEISKDDKSPVTIADFAAQAIIIGALHHAFPNDSFQGEETSGPLRADESQHNQVYELVLPMDSAATPLVGPQAPKPASVDEMLSWIDLGGHGKGGDKGRFWVMDPVDGTASFLRGQQYAVSLSLVSNGREVVGVLGCPNISADMNGVSETDIDASGFGIMLTTVRGQESTLRTLALQGLGKPCHLSPLEPCLPRALSIVGSTACDVTHHDAIAELARRFQATFPDIELWSSHIRCVALIVGGGTAPLLGSCQSEIQDAHLGPRQHTADFHRTRR